MSKDKFIEFCVEYLPYKECVERYGQEIISGLDVLLGIMVGIGFVVVFFGLILFVRNIVSIILD